MSKKREELEPVKLAEEVEVVEAEVVKEPSPTSLTTIKYIGKAPETVRHGVIFFRGVLALVPRVTVQEIFDCEECRPLFSKE